MPKLPPEIAALSGKTTKVPITEQLGEIWAHVPEGRAAIRFYDDQDFLLATIVEYYQDYLSEQEDFLDDDGDWAHPTIIPFASVGGNAEDDDESFFSDSFAFLFWDTKKSLVLSTTTDDWDFTELGPIASLGLPTTG